MTREFSLEKAGMLLPRGKTADNLEDILDPAYCQRPESRLEVKRWKHLSQWGNHLHVSARALAGTIFFLGSFFKGDQDFKDINLGGSFLTGAVTVTYAGLALHSRRKAIVFDKALVAHTGDPSIAFFQCNKQGLHNPGVAQESDGDLSAPQPAI